MTTYEPEAKERTELDERDVRALEEYLTVLEDYDRAKDADGLYMVVSESGSEYLVDAREQTCECPDHTHRGVECKHLRRVAYATGAREIHEGADVDPQLGLHVSSATDARVVATDGGTADDEECGECTKLNIADVGSELPCFSCFNAANGGA